MHDSSPPAAFTSCNHRKKVKSPQSCSGSTTTRKYYTYVTHPAFDAVSSVERRWFGCRRSNCNLDLGGSFRGGGTEVTRTRAGRHHDGPPCPSAEHRNRKSVRCHRYVEVCTRRQSRTSILFGDPVPESRGIRLFCRIDIPQIL